MPGLHLTAMSDVDAPSGKVFLDTATVDRLFTNVGEKAVVGALAAGLPAFLLFRRGAAIRGMPVARACTLLGAGFGAGIAWQQGDLYVRHPTLVPPPPTAQESAARWQHSATGLATCAAVMASKVPGKMSKAATGLFAQVRGPAAEPMADHKGELAAEPATVPAAKTETAAAPAAETATAAEPSAAAAAEPASE